ncbi:hypothetical protein QTI66_18380 [Variovorax sp. J22R133]|uniref:hypothetical protein n=1 Tax=Variovorax brevis TaxID=3053503 RepID=UPI0025755FD3|nr:hypothetical protein [Variovorax sp. J22R133]MDM0114127.1 hypothetical protein [Variovorax sp. J22R133]
MTTSTRHVLIPFAGRSTPACQAALGGLRLPNLESLLGRLTLVRDDTQEDSSLSAPHERALAAAMGLAASDGCIPWAAWEAREMGLPSAGDGASWGLLTLCHWQVGIDDVVLGDPNAIDIDAGESATLLAAAQPFFAEDGIALHPSQRPGRWLAQGKVFDGLATASIDRAVGYPISQWSPLSDAARPLRRLQNEMQMLLYTERVNDLRTQRGAPPINSFWVSGTGALPATLTPADATPASVEASLRVSALHDDAAAWTQAWQALDAGVLASLLADHNRGEEVNLTLCGDRAARTFAARKVGFTTWARRLFKREPAAAVLGSL